MSYSNIIPNLANKLGIFGALATGASAVFHIGRTYDHIDHLTKRLYAQEKEKDTIIQSLQDMREKMSSMNQHLVNIDANVDRIDKNMQVMENDVKILISGKKYTNE
jgi:hypothetical protein